MEPHGIFLTLIIWGLVAWELMTGTVRLGGLYRGRKVIKSEKPRLYWFHIGIRSFVALVVTVSFYHIS